MQPPDSVCVPCEEVDRLASLDSRLTIAVHDGYVFKVLGTVRAKAVPSVGVVREVGDKPFPRCPGALREKSYVFSMTIAIARSANMSVRAATEPDQPFRRPVFINRPFPDTKICPSAPPLADVPTAGPKRPAHSIAPARRHPLLRTWLEGLVWLPTPGQAEKSLRLYATALCMACTDGRLDDAVERLEEMEEDAELTGRVLWHGLVVNGLNEGYVARLAKAERDLLARRTYDYERTSSETTLSRDIERAMIPSIRAVPLAATDPDVRQFLQKPGQRFAQTACWVLPFERCLNALAKRKCVVRGGECFVGTRVVWRDVVVEANKLPESMAELPPAERWMSSVFVEWVVHTRTFVTAAVRRACEAAGELDPSACESAVRAGPLCATLLVQKLEREHHLSFEEHKHLMAILLDSHHSPDDAVQYVWRRMSPEARRKRNLKGLQSLLSFMKDKTTHVVRCEVVFPLLLSVRVALPTDARFRRPATLSCFTYARTGRCPWFSSSDTDLRSLLAHPLQELHLTDVEDLMTGRCRTGNPEPACACRRHLLKRISRMTDVVARERSERLVPERVRSYLDFVKSLYPISTK